MKLSDLDPNDIELVDNSSVPSGLKLSDLNESDIELVDESLIEKPFLQNLKETAADTTRGALQGLSMGFGEEALAAAKSTPTAVRSFLETLNLAPEDNIELEDVYTKARDEEREANRLAAERSPIAYAVGDIGSSIGAAIGTGGVGLLGKGALKLGAKQIAKEAAEKSIKEGGLKALTALGIAEGAAQGLGRSEADLTKGDVSGALEDTATGALIGGIAPSALVGTGKLAKGSVKLADSAVEATPVLGDVYSHLKDVGREGAKRMGQTFREAGQESLVDVKNLMGNLKTKALSQSEKYADDLSKAQDLATEKLSGSTREFKQQLQKGLGLVGQDIETQDIQINEALKQIPSHLRIIDGELELGKFNLDDIAKNAQVIGKQITKNKALEDIMNGMRSGDYLQVSENMKALNALIESADPYEKTLLYPLKKSIQQRIDENMQNLPGEAKKLYQKRMDLNKDYNLLASLRDDIGASVQDRAGPLATKMSVAANLKAGPDAVDYKEMLRKAYQSGDQDLIAATTKAIEDAQVYNKFNIKNPELGTMFSDLKAEVSGPQVSTEAINEKLVQRFKESLGEPKEFSSPTGFAKTIEEFGDLAQETKPMEQAENFVQWLRDTYGQNAEPLIQEIQEKAKSFNVLKDAREIDRKAGQDISSKIRVFKKAADRLSYGAGQKIKAASEQLEKIPTMSRANTVRSLTQPVHYKNTVQQFKDSQKQGDAEVNDVE